MRQVEVGGGLERVRERVAEIQPVPRPAIVRVAQAERRLVGGRAAHVEVAAGEQLGLDALGLALPALALGQRLEERLVDHDARGPVERADEVLALRDVDRRLAADARVDLADERRRHGDPRHAAQVGRRGEARRRRCAAAAERDERSRAVEPQLAPEPLDDVPLLRLLAARQLVRRDEPVAERVLRRGAVDAHHRRVGDERDGTAAGHELAEPVERAELVLDAGGGEDDAVGVGGDRVGDLR